MDEKIELVSCGGVVIYRGKALVLFKRSKTDKVEGWVLPKGRQEPHETQAQTALREVLEETGAKAKLLKPIGKTRYTFQGNTCPVSKTVYWFLMSADSFYSKPQAEENFADAGYYKRHEAFHLLKYPDEREILNRAFDAYRKLKRTT